MILSLDQIQQFKEFGIWPGPVQGDLFVGGGEFEGIEEGEGFGVGEADEGFDTDDEVFELCGGVDVCHGDIGIEEELAVIFAQIEMGELGFGFEGAEHVKAEGLGGLRGNRGGGGGVDGVISGVFGRESAAGTMQRCQGGRVRRRFCGSCVARDGDF